MNKSGIPGRKQALMQMMLVLLTVFTSIPVFADDNQYKDPASGCAVLGPSFLADKTNFKYQGGCKAGFAEGKGKATWVMRELPGNPLMWEGTFRAGVFVARAQSTTIAGVYSMFDRENEISRLILAENGHFFFGISFVLGTLTSISESGEGRWEEKKKEGGICLTIPPPLPLLLFGRRTVDEVEPDKIRVQLESRGEGEVILSWGDGPEDQNTLSPYNREVSLKARTPILTIFLLETATGHEEAEKRMNTPRVYRYALNPEYNDYKLILKKNDDGELLPIIDMLVFGREPSDEKMATPVPEYRTACGTITTGLMHRDGKNVHGFMRRDLSQQEGKDWGKGLAERADPLTYEEGKTIYKRVRGEELEIEG
jgi:hypothetical protein